MTEIILGPPGCGKTTTLLLEVEKELTKGVRPSKIGLITFTKKGATEAIGRAKKKFGFNEDDLPYFRTIHSLCLRRLGLHTTDLLVGNAFKEFAEYAGIHCTGRAWTDDGMLTGFEQGDRILFMENLARIRKVSLLEQYRHDDDALDWKEVQRVAMALGTFKRRRGLLDFTDMLTYFVANGQDVGLELLFVDESQDLSALQWEVVALLARSCRRVVCAGDDDQAIFEWAGADVKHFVEMAGQTRVLGKSWRVPQAVQKLAIEVINGVKHRRPKVWAAKQEKGVVEYLPDFNSVAVATKGNVLVLARNTYILRDQVEDELRRRGIVYQIAGRNSINPQMVQAAWVWEDLKKNNSITLGNARVMYKFMKSLTAIKRGYKKLEQFGEDEDISLTMQDLRDHGGLLVNDNLPWHDALERIPAEDMAYMRAARRHGERLRNGVPRVRLSTIHSIKGGEADHVVLMREIANRTFYEMAKNKLKEDEERRVWYTAITRTQQRLSLINSQTSRECPWL